MFDINCVRFKEQIYETVRRKSIVDFAALFHLLYVAVVDDIVVVVITAGIDPFIFMNWFQT